VAFADKARAKARELAGQAEQKAGDVAAGKNRGAQHQEAQGQKANLKQAGEKLKNMFRK
jgi:hypothetical protein